MTQVSVSRRGWLRGRHRSAPEQRPPWAIAPGRFEDRCTRCDACVAACPEAILRRGDGSFPTVDFTAGACTFCAECQRVCEPAALQRNDGASPWHIRIAISKACLPRHGVECRVCGERCEAAAIRFRPRLGGAAAPEVNLERCTGCGACVAPCPAGAIAMEMPR